MHLGSGLQGFDLQDMRAKKAVEFDRKAESLVMLGLGLDVLHRSLFLGDANRESAIAFLPGKPAQLRPRIVNPF